MACLHRGVLVCRILWIGWGYILRRRAYFYDQNDGTFILVPILEDEIRKLPVLCLCIFDFLNSSSYGAIYISLESHFHVEYNASYIVKIGSVVMEIFTFYSWDMHI